MIYRFVDNEWYNRNISLEHTLVLNYDIMPDQVLFGIRFNKTWYVLFRDKWNRKIRLLSTR